MGFRALTLFFLFLWPFPHKKTAPPDKPMAVPYWMQFYDPQYCSELDGKYWFLGPDGALMESDNSCIEAFYLWYHSPVAKVPTYTN